jgi:DNA polymerase-3 subunit beta
MFAISAEESRFTLNGALLQLKGQGMLMVATDGHRLAYIESRAEISGIHGMHRALLPRKAMSEILKLAGESGSGDMIRFAGDENHLFFRFGDRLLLSRKLTGTFPDFERVLPKDQRQSVTLNRDEFRASIERVSQFADERSRAIRVQFCPGEIRIFSSISDTGESEETVPAEYDGTAVEIGFNAHYLLDFLRAVTEEQVIVSFKDPQSAAEVRPGGPGEAFQYRYVVMPMRI